MFFVSLGKGRGEGGRRKKKKREKRKRKKKTNSRRGPFIIDAPVSIGSYAQKKRRKGK